MRTEDDIRHGDRLCPVCGNEISSTLETCSECGAKIGKRNVLEPLANRILKNLAVFLLILAVVVVILLVVISAMSFFLSSPTPKPLTVNIENETILEVRVGIYVDGEFQGWDYIAAGAEGWYRFEDFSRAEAHEVKITSSALLGDYHGTTTPGKNMAIIIHQDGRATYYLW